MLTIGTLVVGAFLIVGKSPRVLRWARGWVAVWFVTLLALTAFTLSDIEAISPFAALNPSTWWPFLSQGYVGRVFAFQLISVALLWVLLALLSRRVKPGLSWVALILGVSASAAPALLGHGGFSNEHVAMTISLGIHIAAVSLWVGGLAACVAALVVDRSLASTLMPRFSLLALWCVVVLAETGLLNASLRVGAASAFVGSMYGSLVLVKAVLLGWLIWFGWQQRSKVLPKLAHSPSATPAIAKYAGLEFLLMAIAIAVSITLSRIGFESTTANTGSFTPVAIVVLALIGPLLFNKFKFNTVKPRREVSGKPSFIRNYPEFASVVLVVAIIEVCGIGLTEAFLGIELGVIFGSLVLFASGWLWSISLSGPRRSTGIIMMMVGFPVALLLADALAENTTDWRILTVTILIAESILTKFLLHRQADFSKDASSLETAHV
jgi:putative copper export protein